MFKRLMIITLLAMSLIAMSRSEVKAQYDYIGSSWDVCAWLASIGYSCSYHHSMKFKVPGNVVNQGTLFFLSDAVWYDNRVICKNKGGNISFSPGIGHISTQGFANLDLQTSCVNRGKGGECEATVIYATSVAELSDPANGTLDACRAAVGNNNLDAQQCFLKFYGLENFHCANKNDTPIEIQTKGVCTTATAATCTDSTCTEQDKQGVRFTFPSFDQQPGNSFAVQLDDRCVACVNGTGSCAP